ncbi:MAG: NAD(P)/FAD-dependent oxidoreductase [Thermodesulfobacteriota bacterium]
MSQIKTDAIVIGSGISGLTAAALLAKNGRKVVIVEQHKKPGGALRRFTRGGIPFDIGFHYTGGLGQGQILKVLWEYLGVWPGITPQPIHPDGYDFFKFPESKTEVKGFYSYEKAKAELHSVFPHEVTGINQYLDTINNLAMKIPFFNLDLPFSPFLRDFFSASDQPLIKAISSMINNPELQAVLSAPTLLYGVPPDQAGLTMHASVAHSYYTGAWGVQGGGQAIVDSFLRVLAENGVEIITGQLVEQIDVSAGQVTGITIDDRKIPAKQVIYTGHPVHFPGLVTPGSFRPAFSNRIKNLEDTSSMFVVFGKLAEPAAIPALNHANLYSITSGFSLMDNPPEANGSGTMLMTAPGRRDQNSSTGNNAAARGVILMRPASWAETARFSQGFKKRSDDYQQWKTGATKDLINQAAGNFGEACHNIKPLAAGSPLTFRDELGSPAGGVYGVQHNLQQYVARARTKVQGLYLSGQGSLMAGLLGASMSGLVTASEIMGLDETWDRVKQCH